MSIVIDINRPQKWNSDSLLRALYHQSSIYSQTFGFCCFPSPLISTIMGFGCRTCSKTFSSLQGLSSHCRAKSHRANDCRDCERFFVSAEALQQHLVSTSRRHAWCARCSRSFGSSDALRQHISSSSAHRNRIFECPFCSKTFKAPSALAHHIESGCHKINRHQVTAAVKQLKIVPEICINRGLLAQASTPPSITTHYIPAKLSFNVPGYYDCYLCKKRFTAIHRLAAHLNSPAHDADQFRCPKCKKTFKLVSALTQHIESGACRLANLHEIEGHFDRLTAGLNSRLLRF